MTEGTVDRVVARLAIDGIAAAESRQVVRSGVPDDQVGEPRADHVGDPSHGVSPLAVGPAGAEVDLHRLGSLAEADGVDPIATGDCVVAGSGYERVVARSTLQPVVSRSAHERVVPLVPHDDIVAGCAEYVVVPRASKNFIGATSTANVVGAAIAPDHVRLAVSRERVGVPGADEVLDGSQLVGSPSCGGAQGEVNLNGGSVPECSPI